MVRNPTNWVGANSVVRDEEGLGAEFGAVEISNSSLDKGGDLLNEVGRYQGFFSLFQGDLISG